MRHPAMIVIVATILGQSATIATARAEGWLFCVVSGPDGHDVAVTDVFTTRATRLSIENQLVDEEKRRRGLDVVAQCPLPKADRGSVVGDQTRAVTFNRSMGNRVEIVPEPSILR
ncbi:hypothetical protein EYW49_07710 [Siculibacillus lacustris]|uniref:Uncharacterized protein n=1 Tax=Siculibacillus lacustris TaxID=1549641 RepID=A0A4Q9VVE6_9HYPH|nr:hypothetical protein [Siculibacillus lacustris]TBW39008.1 hypothetical protein EYW49_07710 [Siculibacillus lacustris]